MINKIQKADDVTSLLQMFGKYQILQYIYICLPVLFVAMNNVNYVFVAGDIDYRCEVSECEYSDVNFKPEWWPNADIDRCTKPILNYTNLQKHYCKRNNFLNATENCLKWTYKSNDTIIAWLNLACASWKASLVGTVHSLGLVIGTMIGGLISDRFGRKPTLIFAAVGTVIGNVKTVTKPYYIYIFVELIESIISGGVYAAGMVLIIEISGKDKRVLSGVLFAYSIYLGETLLACIAMIVPNWKNLIYITCTPTLGFLLYIKILRESPRWQVVNHKNNEAKITLKLIAKLNKVNINAQDINYADEKILKQACGIGRNEKKEGLKEAFKSKEIIVRFMVSCVARFTVTFIFYGLLASSVWLPGNKYTNYILATVMSFPGDLMAMFFLDRIGRRIPLFYGFLVCGVASVTLGFIPEFYKWPKLVLFFITKLIVTACYTGNWTYTMELFPTSVRGSLFGLCTLVSSAGTMLAPFTPTMAAISPILPSICFGCCCFITSFLILLLPETKGLPLLGTIEDVTNDTSVAKKISTNVQNR